MKDSTDETGQQMTEMHPVKLTSTGSGIESGMIEDLLRGQGISVMRRPLESGGYMNICMGFSIYGEDLYVDEADYPRAKEQLEIWRTEVQDEEMQDEPGEEVPVTEPDWQTEEPVRKAGWGMRILILTMVAIFGIWVVMMLVSSLLVLLRTL